MTVHVCICETGITRQSQYIIGPDSDVRVHVKQGLIYHYDLATCGFINVNNDVRLTLEYPAAEIYNSYILVNIPSTKLYDLYDVNFTQLASKIERGANGPAVVTNGEYAAVFYKGNDMIIYAKSRAPDIKYELDTSESSGARIRMQACIRGTTYKSNIGAEDMPDWFDDFTEFYRAFTEMLKGISKTYEHDSKYLYITMKYQYVKFGKFNEKMCQFTLAAEPASIENKVDYLMARV